MAKIRAKCHAFIAQRQCSLACFTDEAWNWIPDMLSRRLSLKEERDYGEPIAKTESAQFPFENVFAVYATWLSNLGCDSVMSFTNSAFDPIWDAVREEAKLQAFKEREPARLSYSSALLYLKGYHSLQSYRVAHALWKEGHKLLAFALQSRISEVFGIDILPAARIGDGILLGHGMGVVIGETAVIGNQVSLKHEHRQRCWDT